MSKPAPRDTRKVTASDVAERAGVSKWTVSRAFTEGAYISPAAREAVMQAAQELGYRPNLLARSLKKKRTQLVGLVVDEFDNLNILQVLNEVTRQLQRRGLSTLLLNIDADHSYQPALQLADQFQVDGVIFLGSVLPPEFVHLVQEIRHIPLVVLYRDTDIPGIQVFNTADTTAGRRIAQLLLEQGCRRLGYLAGPPTGSTRVSRLDGYAAELVEQGQRLAVCLEAGDYQSEHGFKALSTYLAATPVESRIDALFCENDNLAIGALEALRAAGAESTVALVGFDGIPLGARPSFQLTTYRQPIEALTEQAVNYLLSPAPDLPARVELEGELVLRQSHRRAAAG